MRLALTRASPRPCCVRVHPVPPAAPTAQGELEREEALRRKYARMAPAFS